jgi:mannose-6-phosphate isomerase-like protein (cupin superfamily)
VTRVIDLAQKFASFSAAWQPKILAEVNGQDVRIAKIEGPFEWHRHDQADEMFLVVSGKMRMRFRDGDEVLGPGQMIVVPRGTEHMPVAEPTAEILMIETAGTRNTGEHVSDRTAILERI